MSAQLAAYGRLGSDPVERTGQSGKVWATASIAITMQQDGDTSPLWMGVVAFGRAAETLCRHTKGDLLSVSGQMKLNRWRDNAGNDREQLQVIADTVISAKTVRPGGGRRSGEARA